MHSVLYWVCTEGIWGNATIVFTIYHTAPEKGSIIKGLNQVALFM